MLDYVHILYHKSIASGDLLLWNLETLAKDKDVEGAARYVMVRLEYLKGLDEGFSTRLFIQGDALESKGEGAFKLLGPWRGLSPPSSIVPPPEPSLVQSAISAAITAKRSRLARA